MIRIARFARVAVWSIVFGWVFLGSAQAAIVQIDNPSVNYILEYDDTDLGLYGTPTIGGTGKVEFTPPNFRAQSSFGFCNTPFTGGPACAVQSDLKLTLIARTGFAFDGLTLDEGGTYKLKGVTGFVDANGFMNVWEGGTISGAFNTDPILNTTSYVSDNVFRPWAAASSSDLTGLQWDGISTIDILVSNTLEAFSAPSTSDAAEILKLTTGAGVSLGVDMNGGAGGAVPVPAAVWLFGSGLLGLVGVARRKGRQSV